MKNNSQNISIEQALRDSEETVKALLNAPPDTWLLINRNGIILYVNEIGAKRLKFSVNDLIGRSLYDLLNPKLAAYRKAKIEEVISTNKPVRFEDVREGIIFDISLYPIADLEGRVNKIAFFASDITERRLAEDALRESERNARESEKSFKTLFDEVSLGILIADQESKKFISANPEMCFMLGYSVEELKTLGVQNIHPSYALESIINGFEKQSQGLLRTIYNIPCIHKDGKTIYCDISVARLTIKGKDYLAGCFTNVTERKLAEDALSKSEEKFRSIVEVLPDWIWEVNAQGIYTYASPKILSLMGYQPDEVVGKTPFDFMSAGEAEKIAPLFKSITERRQTFYNLENRNLHKNGHEIIVETSGVPLFDEKGALIGYRGVDRDVTERKKNEHQLRETNAQLIQAEKLTSLGQMAAGISHELNQPLNVIDIIAQKTKRKIQKGAISQNDMQDILQTISSQVRKMANIIDHMRIYTRKTDININEKIDIDALINGSFIFLTEQLRIHSIEVITKIEDNLPRILGDQIRLEQVIMNLITNSRYAVEKSGRPDKKIEIGAYLDNENLAIYVKDNGIGITENHMNKIFDPFFTTKEVGQGTGLGLYVVKKIIEEHNGKIEIESKVNIGTTFKVILPVKEI